MASSEQGCRQRLSLAFTQQVQRDLRVVRFVRPAHGVTRALCGQHEDGNTGQAGSQEGQVILRDRVDPVKIFENQHMEPSLAPRYGQRPDRLERFLPLVLRVQMLECLIRAGETKHVRDKWKSPAEGRIQPLDTLAKLLLDLERVVILLARGGEAVARSGTLRRSARRYAPRARARSSRSLTTTSHAPSGARSVV